MGTYLGTYTSLVKFTFPLNANLVSCPSYLLEASHRAFVPIGQGLAAHGTNVTIRLTRVTVPETAVELIHGPCLLAVPVHTEIRDFWQTDFSPVPSVPYPQSFRLLDMQQPHQGFLAVVIIAAVTPSRYEAYAVGLQKPLAQHLITRGGDEGLEENLDVADLDELPPEYLARLSQHGDVILTVLFEDPSVIKHSVLLTFVSGHEFTPVGMTHLVDPVIRGGGNGAYIVQICPRIEVMWVPRFGNSEPECFRQLT